MPPGRGGEADSRENSKGDIEALPTTCCIASVGSSDLVVSIPVILVSLKGDWDTTRELRGLSNP